METLAQACVDTVAANEVKACYLRPVVVRTGEQMGVYPIDVPVETYIIAWKWGHYLGDDALQNGVDVCVSSWRRAAPDTIPGLAKAGGNYLGSQLSKMEARLDRYAEGIMLDAAALKPRESLTRDHLIPLSRGGTNDWTNVVTACSPCNTRKGNRLPEELGMHPMTHPSEPHFVHLSWAVRRLSPIQSKYIRLFYGEDTLHQLEVLELRTHHRADTHPGAATA
jgi:hypothetical protein